MDINSFFIVYNQQDVFTADVVTEIDIHCCWEGCCHITWAAGDKCVSAATAWHEEWHTNYCKHGLNRILQPCIVWQSSRHHFCTVFQTLAFWKLHKFRHWEGPAKQEPSLPPVPLVKETLKIMAIHKVTASFTLYHEGCLKIVLLIFISSKHCSQVAQLAS
jgi:hypothetical protein